MRERLVDSWLPQCKNAKMQQIRREVDLAWLAGIVDGEGCLSVDLKLAQNGKMYLMPKIRIINTDVRMIQKVARIYADLGVVFYYNLNKKRKASYKDQVAIIVSSQGSSVKVLEGIIPHLANKQDAAQAMLAVINFVQSFPKGGNTSSYDYTADETFQRLMADWNSERILHIAPSTTTRRAGEVIAW
jgi:hypothetical protein